MGESRQEFLQRVSRVPGIFGDKLASEIYPEPEREEDDFDRNDITAKTEAEATFGVNVTNTETPVTLPEDVEERLEEQEDAEREEEKIEEKVETERAADKGEGSSEEYTVPQVKRALRALQTKEEVEEFVADDDRKGVKAAAENRIEDLEEESSDEESDEEDDASVEIDTVSKEEAHRRTEDVIVADDEEDVRNDK